MFNNYNETKREEKTSSCGTSTSEVSSAIHKHIYLKRGYQFPFLVSKPFRRDACQIEFPWPSRLDQAFGVHHYAPWPWKYWLAIPLSIVPKIRYFCRRFQPLFGFS